jgi:selenocysteine lyase/cysteine desulfurase
MDLRQEFPLDSDLIYLNHAAVAPWPRRTADAVRRFADENISRGAAEYASWMAKETELRQQCRLLINAPASEDIALVKNTSEGLSFVAMGLDWQPGDVVVTSDEEFPSNRMVWEALADRGVELIEVDLNAHPEGPEAALIAACGHRTRLLSISSVEYASGLQLDLAILGDYCQSQDILFCVDAIQSLGALPFDVQAVRADFVVADGHKWLLAPEGLGLFYVRPDLRERLRLIEFGWHMSNHPGDFDTREWQPSSTATRFECGSPNMLGAHALSASLSLLLEVTLEEVARKILANTEQLLRRIAAEPRLTLATSRDPNRYAGIVSFSVADRSDASVFKFLRQQGVVCALRAGKLRFSPHFYTSSEQLERAVDLTLQA